MISGHGNIETAVAAIKRGAYDFIEKPFKADRLVLVADARAGNLAAQARGQGAASSWRRPRARWSARPPAMNQLRQTDRAGRADQQPHPDRRARRARARSWRRARIHSASARAERAVRRHQRRRDHAGADGSRAVRRRAGQRRASGARSARSKRRMAARCSSTKSPTCRARPRARSCACWSTRRSSASAAPTKVSVDVRIISSTARNLEAEIAEGRLPRGSLPPAVGGADPRAAAGRAARGHPRAGRLFHGPDLAADRPAEAPDRRGRDGGAAVARLAGQRPPAAQQHRAADDPGRRRAGRRDHRRHAAAGRRLDGADACRPATAASTSWGCRCARRAKCSSANI